MRFEGEVALNRVPYIEIYRLEKLSGSIYEIIFTYRIFFLLISHLKVFAGGRVNKTRQFIIYNIYIVYNLYLYLYIYINYTYIIPYTVSNQMKIIWNGALSLPSVLENLNIFNYFNVKTIFFLNKNTPDVH